MRKIGSAALAVAGILASLAPGGARATTAEFKVGAAVRDITPNSTVAPPNGCVYLGGFGIGTMDGRLACPGDPAHPWTPIKARAMVISNGTDTLAFAINETQGMFAAYDRGPWGLDDARAKISANTGIPMTHIVLGSDHSHRGPDTTGVFGGVPDTYLQYIRDQLVAAVESAYSNMENATITVGSVDHPEYWGADTWDGVQGQDIKDTIINALQAKRVSDGSTIVTFLETPYHSTDYGSDVSVHPDWPGVVSEMLAAHYGGIGISWEGDIGRQYADSGGDTVSNRFFTAAKEALAAAVSVTDDTVKGNVIRFVEPVTNPLYIYFLSAASVVSTATCQVPYPDPICTPVERKKTPPYGGGVVAGTYATVFRVGDIFFAGGPGEVYPNVKKDLVDKVGAGRLIYLGLAQDQIGYLISPAEAFPGIVATHPDSDNWMFNASPTVGDHLECTQLAGAAALGFTVTDVPPRCPALTASDPVVPQN